MRRILLLGLAAPFVLTVAIFGCSSDAEPADAGVDTGPGLDASPEASVTEASVTADTGVDAAPPPVIGPSGGAVVSSDGRAQLAVPALTVDTGTTIAIASSTKPIDATIASAAYELSPNGTTFARDLDLCIETTNRVNAQDACLAYYDEASSKWKCEDKCLKRRGDTNVLCGKTNHFTSFAVLLSGNGATAEGACESGLVPAAGGSIAGPNGDALATFAGGTLGKPTRVSVTKVPGSDPALASAVFELDANGTTSFTQDVEVCIRRDPAKAIENACLGYLDKSTEPPKWRCEDRCLSRRGDGGLYCGTTDHFTNLAILLNGGAASASCADAVIPPAGGKLISLDNVASFIAQDGTFTKATRVTIARAPSEKGLGSDVFQLLPDGPLPKPGRVCLTPDLGVSLATACLGYKDDAGGWKCEDTCLEADAAAGGELCGETSHFTNFAILLQGGTGVTCVK